MPCSTFVKFDALIHIDLIILIFRQKRSICKSTSKFNGEYRGIIYRTMIRIG